MATVAMQEIKGTQNIETEKPAKKQSNKDLQKTRLCVYNLEGKCGYGANCTFAHTSAEIRGVPDLRKTQLCAKFQEGKCSDENCTFAHGEEELKDSPNLKKKICKWHAKGQCRNGNKCGFAHDVSELRVTPGVEPPPGFKPVAEPHIGPPPGLELMKPEVDSADASTEAPSSKKSTKSNKTAVSLDAQLFHFQAARGAAPLKDQVQLMSSAVGALQAKLAALEGMVVQTQVTQMQQSIQQLSEQCWALEAGIASAGPQPEASKSRLSAKATPFVPFGNDWVSDDSTSAGSDY